MTANSVTEVGSKNFPEISWDSTLTVWSSLVGSLNIFLYQNLKQLYAKQDKPVISIVKYALGYPVNPLRPNNDASQTSHCNIKGVSVSEVMRIENMITQMKFY